MVDIEKVKKIALNDIIGIITSYNLQHYRPSVKLLNENRKKLIRAVFLLVLYHST
jgi:hypothetical protein